MNDEEFTELHGRFTEISETDALCRKHLDELLAIQEHLRGWLDDQPEYTKTTMDWHNCMTAGHIISIKVRSFADDVE